jgi:DNA repair exonuclease SbcCD ATPase subunit
MKRLIALAVVALFVTGCATREQQAQSEGAAIGAVGGALLGAAIGGLVTQSARGAAIGAGVGLATGGAAGFVYANSIVKRQEELAGKENDLNARIKFARGLSEDTEKYNKQLKKDVAALTPEIDTLAEGIKQGQAQEGDLKAKKQELNEKVKIAEQDLAKADEQLQDLRNFKSRQAKASKELDTEIKKLEGSLAQLKSNTTALASLNQKI